MLKKTVTYTDFNGNKQTEDCYFNLTQTEAIEFALELPDGVTSSIDPNATDLNKAGLKLAESLGSKGIFAFIKKLVLKSYGIKREDGKGFKKSEEISADFAETIAFDQILMELMQDDEAAANFVNAVIPAELADKVKEAQNGPKLIAPSAN